VRDRWLDLKMFDQQPFQSALSGLKLEYRIIELYSRDVGKREAKIAFNVGQGTQDLGFRNDVPVLFTCQPAQTVTLRVQDENGAPATAAFVFRTRAGASILLPTNVSRLILLFIPRFIAEMAKPSDS